MDSDFMFLTIQLYLDRCIFHRTPMRRALASLLLPRTGVHDLNDWHMVLWSHEQDEAEQKDEHEGDHHPESFFEHR